MKPKFYYITRNNGFTTITKLSTTTVTLGVLIFAIFMFIEGLKPKCQGDGDIYPNICDINSLETNLRSDLELTESRPYILAANSQSVEVTQEAIHYDNVYDAVRWAWGEAELYANETARSGATSKFTYKSTWGDETLLTITYDSEALQKMSRNEGTGSLVDGPSFYEYSNKLDCVDNPCDPGY